MGSLTFVIYFCICRPAIQAFQRMKFYIQYSTVEPPTLDSRNNGLSVIGNLFLFLYTSNTGRYAIEWTRITTRRSRYTAVTQFLMILDNYGITLVYVLQVMGVIKLSTYNSRALFDTGILNNHLGFCLCRSTRRDLFREYVRTSYRPPWFPREWGIAQFTYVVESQAPGSTTPTYGWDAAKILVIDH